MSQFIAKSFSNPDETQEFPKTKVEIVNLDEFTVSRMIFEPGWRWSESLPEYTGTETCQNEKNMFDFI